MTMKISCAASHLRTAIAHALGISLGLTIPYCYSCDALHLLVGLLCFSG